MFHVLCFMSAFYIKSLIFNQSIYLSSYKANNYSKIQFRVPKPGPYMAQVKVKNKPKCAIIMLHSTSHLFNMTSNNIRLQNSRFFLKISKEIGKAWRSVSPQSRSLFSASFQTLCLSARAYLNTQKFGLFCSL